MSMGPMSMGAINGAPVGATVPTIRIRELRKSFGASACSTASIST